MAYKHNKKGIRGGPLKIYKKKLKKPPKKVLKGKKKKLEKGKIPPPPPQHAQTSGKLVVLDCS
jgi:hypothetical protein